MVLCPKNVLSSFPWSVGGYSLHQPAAGSGCRVLRPCLTQHNYGSFTHVLCTAVDLCSMTR